MTRLSVFIIVLCAVIWFALLGHRDLFDPDEGRYAFLLCISYFMVVVLGHYLTLHMLLSSLMFMGIGCLLIAQSQRRGSRHLRNWMLAGWAALALATLTKGPVAVVLPGAAVFVYSLWQSYAPWILTAGILYLIAAVFLTFRRNQPLLQVSVAAVLSLTSANLIMAGSGALGGNRSSRIVADVISNNVPAGTPVFSFQSYPEAAPAGTLLDQP